ncbi:hypothetical protein MLD38_030118 [Melastoma candidum]|uniref:Uncharacterized protein n=1 Tax=Melastoma candidum TaxID=119954 RepID=A0ACB9MMK4_9MYRT|nr:hypothetical protein MLD38_030118 [Melastoma candidum]
MNTSTVTSLFFILEHAFSFLRQLLLRLSRLSEAGTKPSGEKAPPPTKRGIEGITENLRQVLEANMDEAPARRWAREAFKDIQLGIDHCLLKNALEVDGVRMEESYEANSRGVDIFSKIWLPKGGTSVMKAVVCYCHGYGDTCSFLFEGVACRLASFGYGVLAMDYPGFGLSEGLHGYIPSFDGLVDDVMEHYSKIKEKEGYRDKPFFLFGQSMGGAIALRMHLKQPYAWAGAILVAPLCRFGDDMLPPKMVKLILIGLAKVFPRQKLVPQRDMTDMGCRDSKKKKLAPYNVVAYTDNPRLGTALELLRMTQQMEGELEQVSLPMLILHGEADVVTDPSVSKALYQKARSSDKELCLYKDAYHSLLEGEPDATILKVLEDILSWLEKRC